jgi:hypothetical protein
MQTEILQATVAVLQQYQLRFVTSWNQLLEKITILESGLDDAIVEFLKLWVGERALGTPEFADGAVLFRERRSKSSEELELAFDVHRGNEFLGVFSTPLSAYENFARQAAAALQKCHPAGEWKTVNIATIRG